MSEIDSLLEPISEDQPAGPDLRLDPGDLTFQTLKDYTTTTDPAVSDDEGEPSDPNWHGVEGVCTAALREKSKDLELIAGLAEAWVHTEGVEGIALGMELLHESVTRFWDTLHPGYDEDDDEITLPLRARWLNWMDTPKGYIQALKECPLVQAEGGVRLTWRDYENSALLDDATLSPERRQELLDAGVIGSGQWDAALGSASSDQLREVVTVFEGAAEKLRELGAFCAEKFDEDAPDFYNLINALDEIREYFAEKTGSEAPTDAPVTAAGAVVGAGAPAAGGPIQTRQEALRQLALVGDWFRRSEPHSPISYLVARAVKWGSMPLDQLFKDVVRNEDVIEHIWETLGLDASSGKNDGDEEDY